MLLIVSIVSSCIDVACHVNMHFGVSAGKNKEALFHNFCVGLSLFLIKSKTTEQLRYKILIYLSYMGNNAVLKQLIA